MQMYRLKHIDGFDFLRVFAGFSVVWIHGSDTNAYAGDISKINSYAVPAFILMSIYLLIHKSTLQPLSFTSHFYKLLKRIIPAYFFWTFIYIIARFFKAFYLDESFQVTYYEIFLGGSSYHLWFLPAIIVFHLMAFSLLKVNNFFLLAITVAAFVGGQYLYDACELKAGFEKLLFYYLGYPLAALLIYKMEGFNRIRAWFVFSLMVFSIIVFLFFNLSLFTIVFNLAVFVLFLNSSFKTNWIVTHLSSISFGVYLAHALFVEGIQFGFYLFNFDYSSFMMTFVVITFSYIVSAIFVTFLQKIRYLRWTIV